MHIKKLAISLAISITSYPIIENLTNPYHLEHGYDVLFEYEKKEVDSFNQSNLSTIYTMESLPKNKLTIYSKWEYNDNVWNRTIREYELGEFTKEEFNQVQLDDLSVLNKRNEEQKNILVTS